MFTQPRLYVFLSPTRHAGRTPIPFSRRSIHSPPPPSRRPPAVHTLLQIAAIALSLRRRRRRSKVHWPHKKCAPAAVALAPARLPSFSLSLSLPNSPTPRATARAGPVRRPQRRLRNAIASRALPARSSPLFLCFPFQNAPQCSQRVPLPHPLSHSLTPLTD